MYEIILGQKFFPLATRTSAGGFQSEGRHISAAEPPQLRIVNRIDSNDMLAGASQSVEISRIWWGEYSCYDTGKWRQWLVNIKIAAPSQFFRKEMLMESIKRLFNWENDKEVNIVQEEQLPTARPPDRWRLSPVDLVWLEDVLRHLFGDGERESVKAKNSTELI